MRVRWNKTDIDEVKTINFVPFWNADNDDDWGVAVDIDYEYSAYLNREKFSSLEDAIKWAEKQSDEILVKGFWDLTKLKDYVDIV